jgi:hypothetical protein
VKRAFFAGSLALAAGATMLGAGRPRPTPTPIPSPDPVAERMFTRAKEWWRTRKDVPYLEYGALIRYKHAGHVIDNWWEATFRTSDNALHIERLIVPEDEAKRLRGFPITIFGFRVFDTNPDAEVVHVQEPLIEPTSNFGVLTRYQSRVTVSAEPTENPLLLPEPSATALRVIGNVEVSTRDYDVRLVGEESLRYGDAYHLTLTPLRDPRLYRLRDLWLDKTTYATTQLTVDGIYNGRPYDAVRWTVHYVPLGGQWYVQQIRGDNLHFGFGLEIVLEAMEIDFVDYHFPTTVPKQTFEKLL